MNVAAYLLGFSLTTLASFIFATLGSDYEYLSSSPAYSSDFFTIFLYLSIMILNLGVWLYLYNHSKKTSDKKIRNLANGVLTSIVLVGVYGAYLVIFSYLAAKFGCCW
jgi:hypothetical protein